MTLVERVKGAASVWYVHQTIIHQLKRDRKESACFCSGMILTCLRYVTMPTKRIERALPIWLLELLYSGTHLQMQPKRKLYQRMHYAEKVHECKHKYKLL